MFAEFVFGDDLEFAGAFEDECQAAAIVQIDSAVRPDGRCINVGEALEACAVDVGFAALGVHAGEKGLVGLGEVEI